MYVQHDPVVLLATLDDFLQIEIDLVDQNNWGLHFGSPTIGVHLGSLDVHLGAHPLPGDLDQPKFARGQYFVFCPVLFHFIAEMFKELSSMISPGHVDEVHHYDAPMSRNCNCLAISEAADILTSRAVSSWFLALFERLPLLTSITCRASVCSMTK